MMSEAKRCYRVLVDSFGDTERGQEAAAVLRRLNLPGQRLSQFAGPTLSGEFLTAEDLKGRVTLIYFWSMENDEFVEVLLPLLKQVSDVSGDQLQLVGVSLDHDESLVRSFVTSRRVPGRQVYFPDPNQRSWESPLIKFWGISRIPSVWLVGETSIVNEVDVRSGQLVDATRKLF